MKETITNYIQNYYLLNLEPNQNITIESREVILKKMLTRIFYVTSLLAVIILLSVIFQVKIISQLFFPLFLISLIPYYIYGWMVKFHKRDKRLLIK